MARQTTVSALLPGEAQNHLGRNMGVGEWIMLVLPRMRE
jgi:hypothetical protein